MNQMAHIFLCATMLATSLAPTQANLMKSIEHALGKTGRPSTPAPAPPLPISPREFVDNVCTSASDPASCQTIVTLIVNRTPQDEALNATKVALRSARKVQSEYKDVALTLQDKIQQLNARNDSKLKPALSSCYKMYMDISHEMHEKTMHLKLKKEVCTGKNFAGLGEGANPEVCEEALVRAGTTGQAMGLYRNYNELVHMAGACDSVIAYMVQTGIFKTRADCSTIAPSPA